MTPAPAAGESPAARGRANGDAPVKPQYRGPPKTAALAGGGKDGFSAPFPPARGKTAGVSRNTSS